MYVIIRQCKSDLFLWQGDQSGNFGNMRINSETRDSGNVARLALYYTRDISMYHYKLGIDGHAT